VPARDNAGMPRKVFVSGTFDLLHSGHVAFLAEAATHGDLYAAIGNDECVFRLKGKYPVNSQDERKYMIDALRSVKECRISRGTGLLDFVDELREIRPDVFVVNEDGAHESKAQLCRELGIEYLVLRRLPHGGLPVRSTTALREECAIPFRIDLAGGWLDQPFVSQLHAGAVLTISIEPTHAFNTRSGMASSTRNKAIELWRHALPQGNKEQVARILFSYENPPGTQEVAGSQDAIGIVYPGLNRLDYTGGYWPCAIESVQDEDVLSWLERRLQLVPLEPRAPQFSVLADTRITAAGARALAAAADDCWHTIRAMDLRAFGLAFTASFDAQVAMFPNMVNREIADLIDAHRSRARGWKLSGAGGGGYLILVTDQAVPGAVPIRIRRPYAAF
jgi:cytidyltransferase-like protein